MTTNAHCSRDKIIEKISISPGDIPEGALAKQLPLRVKSRGQSMYPAIKPGDTLLIRMVNADNLEPGDIAFYCLPSGTFVVHRLIKRNGAGSLLTNGDSLRQADDPVTTERVFGKVTGIERGGKSLVLTGILSKLIGRSIVLLARYRLPLQIHIKQTLGRIHWLIGGRRIA
jgi:signal peptidase I